MQIKDPQLQNPFHILAFSHGYRPSNKTSSIHKNPGPGFYNPLVDSPNSPALKFQTSNRHDVTKEKRYIPGPGSYELLSPTQLDLNKSLNGKLNISSTISQNTTLSPIHKGKDNNLS